MLELIVLAQEAIAERAPKYPPAVVPDPSLALLTNGVHQRADAGVGGEATSTMADPRLAVIAYSSLKSSNRETLSVTH